MTRITLVINGPIEKKLRLLQAKAITASPKSVSFSRIVNIVLDEGLDIKIEKVNKIIKEQMTVKK